LDEYTQQLKKKHNHINDGFYEIYITTNSRVPIYVPNKKRNLRSVLLLTIAQILIMPMETMQILFVYLLILLMNKLILEILFLCL
jgi:hypothetical protein